MATDSPTPLLIDVRSAAEYLGLPLYTFQEVDPRWAHCYRAAGRAVSLTAHFRKANLDAYGGRCDLPQDFRTHHSLIFSSERIVRAAPSARPTLGIGGRNSPTHPERMKKCHPNQLGISSRSDVVTRTLTGRDLNKLYAGLQTTSMCGTSGARPLRHYLLTRRSTPPRTPPRRPADLPSRT